MRDSLVYFCLFDLVSELQFLGNTQDQATKGARGMPWRWEPMKGVVNYDMLRGAVNRQ